MKNYIVATIKPWNIQQYKKVVKNLPGKWYLIDQPKKLNLAYIRKINPEFIFFPHWSWKVSDEIINDYESIFCHEATNLGSDGKSPVELFSEMNPSDLNQSMFFLMLLYTVIFWHQ